MSNSERVSYLQSQYELKPQITDVFFQVFEAPLRIISVRTVKMKAFGVSVRVLPSTNRKLSFLSLLKRLRAGIDLTGAFHHLRATFLLSLCPDLYILT